MKSVIQRVLFLRDITQLHRYTYTGVYLIQISFGENKHIDVLETKMQ